MARVDPRLITYGAALGTGAGLAVAARWFPKLVIDRRTRAVAAAALALGGAAGAAYTRRPWLGAVSLVGVGMLGELAGEVAAARIAARRQTGTGQAAAQAGAGQAGPQVASATPQGPASQLAQMQRGAPGGGPKPLPPGRVQFQYPVYSTGAEVPFQYPVYSTGAEVEDLSDSFATIGL